ncbi:MAG: hypothetical protein WBK96_10945 [Candidatus Manganitrophaceae bacterium]
MPCDEFFHRHVHKKIVHRHPHGHDEHHPHSHPEEKNSSHGEGLLPETDGHAHEHVHEAVEHEHDSEHDPLHGHEAVKRDAGVKTDRSN